MYENKCIIKYITHSVGWQCWNDNKLYMVCIEQQHQQNTVIRCIVGKQTIPYFTSFQFLNVIILVIRLEVNKCMLLFASTWTWYRSKRTQLKCCAPSTSIVHIVFSRVKEGAERETQREIEITRITMLSTCKNKIH